MVSASTMKSAKSIRRVRLLAKMATPDRRTLTLSFFKITSTCHRPPRLAVEDSSTGLLLIADLDKSEKLSERTENRNDSFELP